MLNNITEIDRQDEGKRLRDKVTCRQFCNAGVLGGGDGILLMVRVGKQGDTACALKTFNVCCRRL
jgi:hypothetical protein